jgi:DNA-directed RNA polymerase subunit M/transcription elongation factor TFIIS
MLAQQRSSAREALTVLLRGLASVNAAADALASVNAAADSLAIEVEQAAFAAATASHRAAPKSLLPELYMTQIADLTTLLPSQIGKFPDETAGIMLLKKAIPIGDMFTRQTAAAANPDARETGRRLFVRALNAGAPELGRARIQEMATAIEVSCYNAAVQISKESSDPPRRSWDSPSFVDIYSTRCGAVYCALDPSSASCASYGPQLLPRILSGEVAIASVGDMSERNMCPPATAEERAEIAMRSAQRVVEKESTLFSCPHCKARRCTYIEVQRRSLDEAPDYICRCLACNRKFTGKY